MIAERILYLLSYKRISVFTNMSFRHLPHKKRLYMTPQISCNLTFYDTHHIKIASNQLDIYITTA